MHKNVRFNVHNFGGIKLSQNLRLWAAPPPSPSPPFLDNQSVSLKIIRAVKLEKEKMTKRNLKVATFFQFKVCTKKVQGGCQYLYAL